MNLKSLLMRSSSRASAPCYLLIPSELIFNYRNGSPIESCGSLGRHDH